MPKFNATWVRHKTTQDPYARSALLIATVATGILAVTADSMISFVSAFISIAFTAIIGAFLVYFIALAGAKKEDEARMSLLSFASIIAFALALTNF